MAAQDLAYQIAVNDAELRLATQHVAAFNAEVEASTVVGAKLNTSLRATGRQAAQVGNFFIRNLTIPLGLAGVAAASAAAKFDTAIAKIQGLVGGNVQQIAKLRAAALSLASHELTQGPTALAGALFHLLSAGLSVNQAITALKPVSEGAVAGLGDVATVTQAVTSAMDAYGFKTLSAKQATAILIETVTKGNIKTDQLAGAIGRVIPIANALGISFDQVGASIASLTRQGFNPSLAVTGLRAIFQTFTKGTNQTKEALAAVGTGVDAVQLSLKQVGVFPTLLALREQFKGLNVDSKTLTSAFNGNALALAEVKAQVGQGNDALNKLFPNFRALVAFLALTGPRRGANSGIFAALATTFKDSDAIIKRAVAAQENTPIGQAQKQFHELEAQSIGAGDAFLKMGAKLLGLVNGFVSFVRQGGEAGHIIRDFGIALFALGPGIALFGRLTQVASFGVKVFGDWQVRAQKAAFAVAGIDIELDKNTIATRKAEVQFTDSMAVMTGAAAKLATSITGINAGLAATGGAAAVAAGGRAAGGKRSSGAAPVFTPGTRPESATSAANVEAQIAALRVRRLAQVEAATAGVTAAQLRYDTVVAAGATSEIKLAATELEDAKARLAQSAAVKDVLFQDGLLLDLQAKLIVAQERLNSVTALSSAGLGSPLTSEINVAKQEAASLEAQIALRQRILAGQQLSGQESQRLSGLGNTGSLAAVGAGLAQNTAKDAEQATETTLASARVMRTGWGTAIEGMKSTAKLGFDFIALTAAIDLGQKLVSHSSQTKTAVTHDLTDIQKAGIGSIGTLVLLGTQFGPKLAGAFSKMREDGVPAFEALGVATLGWRAKIALAAVSLAGLSAIGVHLETVFNTVFGVMAARAVLSSKLITGGLIKVAGAAGLEGVAAGALEVAGLFVSWEAVAAVALTELLSKIKPIGDAMHGLDNDIASGIAKLGISKHTQGNFFRALGVSNPDFDPNSPKKAIDGAKTSAKDLQKVIHDTFGDISALSPKIQKDVELLVKSGNISGAGQLIQAAEIQQQKVAVTKAETELRQHGQTEVANLLAGTASAAKAAKAELDNIFGSIRSNVLTAFENHTARMLDLFDEQTNNILSAFDDATTKLENNLKVKVDVPKLNETFTVSVNGKTPAERELDALDKLDQKRNFQRDILSANQAVSTARELGDPVALQAALQKQQDAIEEKTKFGLQNKATVERAAADKALAAGKSSLDKRRDQEKQALSDSRDAARRNIEAARTVEEQGLKDALNAQLKMFQSGKIGTKKFYDDILGIMADHKVSLHQAGADGGNAYATALQHALEHLRDKIVSPVLDKITTKAQATATALQTIGSDFAKLGLTGPLGTQTGVGAFLSGPTGTPAAAAAATSTQTVGVPTRPAIANALIALSKSGTHRVNQLYLHEIGNAQKALPQRGQPTLAQYTAFLGKVPSDVRGDLEKQLLSEGFFYAAGGGVVPKGGPPWHAEGPQYYSQAYKFFRPYAVGGNYTTSLTGQQEGWFEQWVQSKGDPGGWKNTTPNDYDMRGFWRDDRMAAVGWTQGKHFPDRWKTPYDTTFSRESEYATRNNPFDWRGNKLINTKTGQVIFSASGSAVKGTDTVPAMLTPGEIILNRNQQQNLGAMLGVGGLGPQALFDLVSRGQHFASGGVVGSDNDPIWKKLLEAVGRNSLNRSNQFDAGAPPSPTGGTIANRNTSGAGFSRPIQPAEITSLVNHMTKGLDREQKIALEAKLAQAQAHPVISGLIDVNAHGQTLGKNPTVISPAAGQLSGSSLDQPITIQGDLNIQLDSSGNEGVDADRLLGAIRRKAKRTSRVRGGRPLQGRLGIA